MAAEVGAKLPPIVSQSKQILPFSVEMFDPRHLTEMVDLWVSSWSAAMPEIDFEARRGWFRNHLDTMVERGTNVLLAFESRSGALAGFATIDCATHWLDQIVIAECFQGSGAAGILLDCARGIASGHIRLDVNAENARARAFYRREGFVEVGRGRNPLSGRETVQMEWIKGTAI